jgi:peptidoglycan/xylan/chitin deacetylase (PgdA/CDA1 family)
MRAFRGRVVRQVYKIGSRLLPRWFRPAPAGPLVLLYHSVEERYDVWTNKLGHNITPRRFAEHVRFLSEHFRLVPFSRICRRDAAPNEVAITFDDGSASIKDTVLPIIEKYRCPIKIYLATSNLSGINWLNKVCYLLNSLSSQEQTALRAAATGAARHGRNVGVHDFVHAFDPQRTPAVIEDYFRKACRGDGRRLYLTAAEACSLAAHPLIEVGSHTRHHYPLSQLGAEQLHDEVVANHHTLNSLLDDRIRGFALPFGFRSQLTVDVAAVVGEIDDMLVSAYGGRLDWQPCHGLPEVKRVSVGGNLGALWYRLNNPN